VILVGLKLKFEKLNNPLFDIWFLFYFRFKISKLSFDKFEAACWIAEVLSITANILARIINYNISL
jgi:hypothetical protein